MAQARSGPGRPAHGRPRRPTWVRRLVPTSIGADHASYSKRAMAADQVGLMRRLGFENFALVGHDRGARVAHRLCLDHPEAVSRVALLDIVPTRHVFTHVDRAMAQAYYHWFFLSQARRPTRTPDRRRPGVLGATQARTVVGRRRDRGLRARGGRGVRPLLQRPRRDQGKLRGLPRRRIHRPRARRGRRCSRSARGVPHARALGRRGLRRQAYDVVDVWNKYATDVRGQALNGGHFLAEEEPDATLAALDDFLDADRLEG